MHSLLHVQGRSCFKAVSLNIKLATYQGFAKMERRLIVRLRGFEKEGPFFRMCIARGASLCMQESGVVLFVVREVLPHYFV